LILLTAIAPKRAKFSPPAGDIESLTERVLEAAFEVSNILGAGFLEKVYEGALLKELGFRGIRATSQVSFPVTYKDEPVGNYFPDILVEDKLVVELKCVDRLGDEHLAQCLNYLKASGLRFCLLVNFQRPKVEWKRIIHGFETEKQKGPRMNTDEHG
jgi:GxxExxY protein